MRTNEPETAEYFSRSLGTKQNVRTTERQRAGTFGKEKTGDGSIRDVEAFIHHPNLFKRELGTGEAVMIVPFGAGNQSVHLKFDMLPDLPAQKLPFIAKSVSKLLSLPPKPAADKNETAQASTIGSGAEVNDSGQSSPSEAINQALDGAA